MNKGDKRCFYVLQPGQKRFVRIYFADTKPPSDNDFIYKSSISKMTVSQDEQDSLGNLKEMEF